MYWNIELPYGDDSVARITAHAKRVTELLPSCYRVVAVRPLVDSFDCYGRNKSIGWPVCVCVCVCCRVCWPFGLLPFVFFFVSCVCVCVCVCVAFNSWGAERCPFRAGGTP